MNPGLRSSKTMALGSYQSQVSDKVHTDVLSEARNSCYKVRFLQHPFLQILSHCLQTKEYDDFVTILNRQETLFTPVWRRNRPKSPPKLPPSVFSTPSNARNLGRILRSCAAPHGYENRLFRSNCLNWLVWSSFFFFLALLGFLNWCWNTWVWVLCFCSNLELIVFFEFLCFLPFWISQFVLKYIVLETPSIDCFDRVFFFLLGLETPFSF